GGLGRTVRRVGPQPEGHEGRRRLGLQTAAPEVEGGDGQSVACTEGADAQAAVLPGSEVLLPALGAGRGIWYPRHGSAALPGVVGQYPGRAGLPGPPLLGPQRRLGSRLPSTARWGWSDGHVLQAAGMTKPSWFEPSQMQALNPLLVMLLIPFNNLVL